MHQEIILKLPNNYILPEYINTFNINENFLMLKLGAEIVYSSTKEILENQLINIRNEITTETNIKFQNKYGEQITFLQNQLIILEQQKENEIKRRIDENLNSVNVIKDIYINTNKELNDKIIDITAQSKIIEEKYNNEKKLIEIHINDEVNKRIENISLEKIRIYDEFTNKKTLQDDEINKLKEKIFLLETENNNKINKIEQDKNNILTEKNNELKQIETIKNNEIKQIEQDKNNILTEKNNEIKQIETIKNNEIKQIETVKNNILTEKNNEIKQIETIKNNEIKQIETIKNNEIKQIEIANNNEIIKLQNVKNNEIKQIEIIKNNEIIKLQNDKHNEFIKLQNDKNNEIKLKEITIEQLNSQIKLFNDKLNKEINCINTEWINKSKIEVKDEIYKINSKYENIVNELNIKLNQLTQDNKELNNNIFKLKEQQLINENTILNKMVEQQNIKSKETMYLKGANGENIFKQMAKDAFKFLDFFDIIDTFNLPQMGDFHLKFENFDVLVDVKNYGNSVQKSQRDKIKNDLSFGTNKNIKFGWLISLYSDIDGFSRGSPFEIEIITHSSLNLEIDINDNNITDKNITQYIFYINQLNNNPTEILLSILSCCKTISKITDEINDDFTVSKYKEYELKVKNNITNIIENNKNIYQMFNDMKKLFINNDKFLQNIINNELNVIFKYNYTVIEWCKKNIIPTQSKEFSLKDAFKKFNSDDNTNQIKMDLFTQILTEYYKNNIKVVKLAKSEKVMVCNFLLKHL
jgi:hypothetical protein